MLLGKFFAYRPEKILWLGFIILGVIVSGLGGSMGISRSEEMVRLSEFKRTKGHSKESAPLQIRLLSTTEEKWRCPIPDIQQEALFSLDPARPDLPLQETQVSVRLKQQTISQKFSVPCRIDLAYRGGALTFAERPSAFWLQLTQGVEALEGQVFVDDQAGPIFRIHLQESPVQTAHEFPESSPFRLLAEGRWWGPDLFCQTYCQEKVLHRIDLGSPLEAKLLDAAEKQWLVFREGVWQPIDDLKQVQDVCIARIKAATPLGLEMEGWEDRRHVRLLIPLTSLSPFTVKADELFGLIRVRSDKQISCVLGKQCLILKVHDWVLKAGDRWKILRKPEEKEAFLKGNLMGEIFVLDQISIKQGQKNIMGRLYSPARTQVAEIDLPVVARQKPPVKTLSKGSFR